MTIIGFSISNFSNIQNAKLKIIYAKTHNRKRHIKTISAYKIPHKK
jgi:hypothetical protein